MNLTEEQLHELLAIIDRHHNAFIANYLSPAVLPPATLDALAAAGIVDPQVQGLRDAFLFGMLGANLPQGGGPTVSYAQLADRLARNPFPLSDAEQHAISAAQMSAGQYISGLGAKVKAQITERVTRRPSPAEQDEQPTEMETDAGLAERDAAAYKQVIAEGTANRKQLGSIATDLGHATGDWTRDLERVAATEMSAALQQGTAAVAQKQFGDDARVAKIARPACCDQCEKLYNDSSGRPIIFSLSDLQNNGTNVGRKARDWRPVCGPTHPNCLCVLTVVPNGFQFGKDRLLVPAKGST